MPLCSFEQAQEAKTLAESLTRDEYEIIEYYNSGQYYTRRKAKWGKCHK